MTGDELRSALSVIWGSSRGWQIATARMLHVNVSTVRRWTSGAVPVPGPVEAWVSERHRFELNARPHQERGDIV